jgi:hypothetical protein
MSSDLFDDVDDDLSRLLDDDDDNGAPDEITPDMLANIKPKKRGKDVITLDGTD